MNDKEKNQGHAKAVNINRPRGEITVTKPGGDDPKQFTFDMAYGDEAS